VLKLSSGNLGNFDSLDSRILKKEEEQGLISKDHLKKIPAGGLPTDGVKYN